MANDGIGSFGTRNIDSYELPYGFWEINSDSLEEQPMFLIAETSL